MTIVAMGKMVPRALKVARELAENKKSVEVINARFLKPLDENTIMKSIKRTKYVITIEDGTKINGLATAIKELIIDKNIRGVRVKSFAYPDDYIRHGTVTEIEDLYNMSVKKIVSEIEKYSVSHKNNKIIKV